MPIIDTHAHLYELPDPLAVLRECAAAGVSDVIALGVDLASNRRHREIRSLVGGENPPEGQGRSSFPQLHLAFGLHPGNITSLPEAEACLEFFRLHVREAVAIGETGLDYWYQWVRKDESRRREQREVFDRHLALAREFDLPVVIHSRGAWRDCYDMAVSAGIPKADFHWYSGPLDVLAKILDRGFLISCTPALAYSSEARQAVTYAPLERLLLETDTPVGYPGLTTGQGLSAAGPAGTGTAKIPSTPRDVWRTLALVSQLKGLPEVEVLAAVNANARALFGPALRSGAGG